MSFPDHFSERAGEYARYRPVYPEALYAHVSSLAPGRDLAWDCATGSGQAAVALAGRFARVVATDASPQQLGRAQSHPNVAYSVSYAERTPLRDHSVDLVTVAAGAHWFDLDRFYGEVARVVRPGGVLAVWSYYMFEAEPAIEHVISYYADNLLDAYWPVENERNRQHYRTLPFPFERIGAPAFYSEAHWDMEHLLGFASTWSATQRYHAQNGVHPFDVIMDDLKKAWGDPARLVHFRWPLHMIVGRVGSR